MMTKRFSLLVALVALSGCLSSDPGSVRVVSRFDDGGGVANGNIVASSGDEFRSILLGPDIVGSAAALPDSAADPNELSFGNFSTVTILPDNSRLLEGTTLFRGNTVDFAFVRDRNSEARVAAFGDASESNILAFGDLLSGTPTGVHTYTGTLGMGERGPIANIDFGSFTMAADFGANSYTFTGATNGGDTLNGSGAFNLQAGTFTSSTFTAVTSGTTRAATVFGQLHGNGGTSVSGVYHTNEATPTHHGGFAGSR